MDLTKFVKETVAQVARGVRQAQGEVRTLGISANSDDTFMVKFDVVVAVSDGQNGEVGNKINVMSVGESVSGSSA